jgi:hyperosmotically inducible periplasmic protein
MKSLTIGVVAALILAGAATAQPDTNDAWLTTKAKITLLTTEGVSATDVNVDTVDGKMTIHGKVGTAAEKAKAEETVRHLQGVKDVTNLLQVVPAGTRNRVDAKDSDIKHRVEASLKTDKSMDDVKVASVNKGVVLLSGKTPSLGQKLLVIERVYTVPGVHGVSSEIETTENN